MMSQISRDSYKRLMNQLFNGFLKPGMERKRYLTGSDPVSEKKLTGSGFSLNTQLQNTGSGSEIPVKSFNVDRFLKKSEPVLANELTGIFFFSKTSSFIRA